MSVEDAIKVGFAETGPITLEEWKRQQKRQQRDVHVVRPQPTPKSVRD